ncbi:MAG: hypothetical protein Q7S86_00225 [bacterium]|nr:hypothetical protein [bacterium]
MKHHNVTLRIGGREYRKYPVAFNPEPRVDDLFEVGEQKIPIVHVSGFDVKLSWREYDSQLIISADKQGFFQLRF